MPEIGTEESSAGWIAAWYDAERKLVGYATELPFDVPAGCWLLVRNSQHVQKIEVDSEVRSG